MKISGLSKLMSGFMPLFNGRYSIYNPPKSLDFKTYPELQTLKDAGANDEQLIECQKSFYLFKKCTAYGWKDCTNELKTSFLEILETKKAEPKHFTVLAGIAAYFIRYNQMHFEDIPDLAKYEAALISTKSNNSPKHIQGILIERYPEYRSLSHTKI